MRFSSFFGRHFLWHSQKKDVSFLLVSFGEGKKKEGKFSAELRKSNSIVKSQHYFFFKVRSSFPFRAFRHEKFTLLSPPPFFFGVGTIHVHNKSTIISFILAQ